MVLQRFYGKPPKLSDKVSCWLGPWDYSVEGTQKRSLGGFSEEGLGHVLSHDCRGVKYDPNNCICHGSRSYLFANSCA